jgi:hypothetical protein
LFPDGSALAFLRITGQRDVREPPHSDYLLQFVVLNGNRSPYLPVLASPRMLYISEGLEVNDFATQIEVTDRDGDTSMFFIDSGNGCRRGTPLFAMGTYRDSTLLLPG